MDTPEPQLPGPGAILAPLLRNVIRYGVGALLALVAAHGLLDPASATTLMASPEFQALLGGIAVALATGVETLWLRARKTGGAR